MSMADNIKKGIQKKRDGMSNQSEVTELINAAASKSLKKFIQRMDSGEIPIDNISDFARVFGIFKEANGIAEVLDGSGGQSALPEINMKQDKAIEDSIEKGKINTDEEGRLNVMDMTSDDVAELLRDMDIAQNKENEGAF